VSAEKRTSKEGSSWADYLQDGVLEKLQQLIEADPKSADSELFAEQVREHHWDTLPSSNLTAKFEAICRKRHANDPDAQPMSWFDGVCWKGVVSHHGGGPDTPACFE
jgi:hypothetical protein